MTVASPSERWGAGSGRQGCRKLGQKTVEKITVLFNSCWSLEVNTAAALDSYAARPLPALLHFNGKGWFPPTRLFPLAAPTYRLRRARCVDSIDRRGDTNNFVGRLYTANSGGNCIILLPATSGTDSIAGSSGGSPWPPLRLHFRRAGGGVDHGRASKTRKDVNL